MAIIYSYPVNTNILATDIILGSSTVIVNGKRKNQTKSFEVADLATYFASVILPPGSYVPYTGAIGSVNLGAYNLTATSIIKAGGTNLQFLMADGSVSTAPSLTGFVPYVGATQAVNLGAFNLLVNGISVGKGAGTGAGNVVVGSLALNANTTGVRNTAIGTFALLASTIANDNTAVGYWSLLTNATGSANTAIGSSALQVNTTGVQNTAIGVVSLQANTTGSQNIGLGALSLRFNTTGSSNVAVGFESLNNNTTASSNVAIGYQALRTNSTGNSNTAIGHRALFGNTTGINNIGIGIDAFTLLGTDNNSIVIGAGATGLGSNTVVIGNTSIATTRLRGAVQGGSFVKDSGTASQYLMADGSVTTSGPLFKEGSSATATGVITVISSAIVGSLFPDGSILKIQTMVSFVNQSLNITPITYYINTSPSLVGATQIAHFDISAGQRYSWMDRSFWSIGGTFNSRNFGNSSQTSVSNSGAVLGSTSIPATFYIIASMNVGVGDLGTIASILIEKQ